LAKARLSTLSTQTTSTPSDSAAQLGALRARYRDEPELFAKERLGLRVSKRQAEILRAMALKPRVAVKSGHKIGKSTCAAIIALWFTFTRPGGRVIMTSSTDRQVRKILWREVRRLHKRVRATMPGNMSLAPDPGLQLADGGEVLGFSTKEPEKMAGFSGADLLFIVDEASGVPEEIFDAIEGNRAGGAKIAMFSNPTQTSGYFFEAFTSRRDAWSGARGELLTVSSEEVVDEGIPGLATRDWIEEMKAERGEDSAFYAVRVKGAFPTQGSNAVVSLHLVETAAANWPLHLVRDENGDLLKDADGEYRIELAPAPLTLGVDVARFGDDETVIYPVRGLVAYRPVVLSGLDGSGVAGEVMRCARRLRVPGERVKVNIDAIGVGSSPVDFLRHHSTKDQPEIELNAVNVATSARDPQKYVLLRDEIWFALSDWLKAGGVTPPDAKLEAELVAPTYKFDPRLRLKVESKDDIKKRLKRSPDRADALGLAVFAPPRVAVDDEATRLLKKPGRLAHVASALTDDGWEDDDE